MKEVKGLIISDGVTYSGATETNDYSDVPHGMGSMKYADHNETGMFQNGELKGIAYLNYHDWMYVGLASDGTISGWGLKVDRGNISFGVFEDNILKINLTPLVEVFWEKILSDANSMNTNAIRVLKTGEIFVGVPQHFLSGKFGFHFLDNGEVFLGTCEYDQSGRTGKFLHFDTDFNITKGEYLNGKLIKEISDDEYIEACNVFINHAYLDFDIKMNYAPESFLLGKTKMMHIFEMGKTPDNLLVKANICTVRGNNIQCPSGDCNQTTLFSFPLDDEIEEELQDVMNNEEHPWVPDFNDYRVDFVNNLSGSGSDHLIVYRHVSCWDKDAYYDIDNWYSVDMEELGIKNNGDYFDDNEPQDDFHSMLSLIPDAFEKKSIMENQWIFGGWHYTYPSVRDYVRSLGTDDDVENFFSWLFNNSGLNNCYLWTLPYNYRNAFEQFLKLFPTID